MTVTIDDLKNIQKAITSRLKYQHPYPEDVFKSVEGKAARVGYNAASRIVLDYIDDQLHIARMRGDEEAQQ